MNFKHIAAAAALLATGSSFAANIAMNGATAATAVGSGLVFFVTDTANSKSYDLDLGVSFAGALAANTSVSVAGDANWTSFYDANRASDFVWSVVAGKSTGPVATAGANTLLTTVNAGFNTSLITTAGAANIATIVGNLDKTIFDINGKAAATSASFVATKTTDIAYFGEANTVSFSNYNLSNQVVSTGFLTYNNIGTTASFLKLANTGGRGAANVYTIAGTYSASFDGSTVSLNTVAVTPAVPEPESYGLALVGLLLAGVVARRRA
jgi:hypothetical protein